MSPISVTSAATSPPDSSPEVLASGGGGALSGIEDAINTVFDPISDAVSAFVFAEITVFGATFPWIVGWPLYCRIPPVKPPC
jgi:alanine or glycine:cation symporter, AGCS family